jgi:site-specific recombinase XerD
MDPDAIDRVVRKYAGELELDRGYSAHSMRATFVTTALDNGAQLEDVQKAAGHRDPGRTKLHEFLSVHAAVHNNFNLQRHLISRSTLRIFRAEAAAQWQSAVAAA